MQSSISPAITAQRRRLLCLRAWACSTNRIAFFFSSRRRHTRCLSDWSSDVCSSDWRARDPDPGTGPAAVALVALVLASCAAPAASSPAPSATTIPIPTTAAPPTSSPSPTPSPRIGPGVVQNVQLVASGLRAPWAVDLASDGRLFVTERAGRVRIVQLGPGGGLRPDPWATLPASTSSDGEKGLLGIALDPDFTQNGFVYLYYSYGPPNGVTRNTVVRMSDQNGLGTQATLLLHRIPGNNTHDGGS